MSIRTKKITLFYSLDGHEVLPPPARELARKDAWIAELQNEARPVATLIIRVDYTVFNPQIGQMIKFFNGVVVLWYALQNLDMVEGEPGRDALARYREEILDDVLGYDYKAATRLVHTRKSTTDFKTVQRWNSFLKTVEETVFDAAGYEFPDTEEFWRLVKLHGYDQAKTITVQGLQRRMKARKV